MLSTQAGFTQPEFCNSLYFLEKDFPVSASTILAILNNNNKTRKKHRFIARYI